MNKFITLINWNYIWNKLT